MAFEIQALSDKIICEVKKHESVSAGGIILPDSESASVKAKKDYLVISIGDEVPETIKIGDTIVCHDRAGMDHMVDGKILKIVAYKELYGVVREVE